MREDFRQAVVRSAVMGMRQLPGGMRSDIERQVKRSVSVPGFRNGAKAPPPLIARHLPEAFDKNPAWLQPGRLAKLQESGRRFDLGGAWLGAAARGADQTAGHQRWPPDSFEKSIRHVKAPRRWGE
jgi:hypothetical protein